MHNSVIKRENISIFLGRSAVSAILPVTWPTQTNSSMAGS